MNVLKSLFHTKYVLPLWCLLWGTWWRSWWGHRATSQKVVSLIPDDATGIFSSIHSLQTSRGAGIDSACNGNENQEYFVRGKSGWCVGLTTLTSSMCRLSWYLGASAFWNPQGLSRPVMGLFYHSVCDTPSCLSCWLKPSAAENCCASAMLMFCTLQKKLQ